MRKPKQLTKPTYLVTKEYGVGMLHHLGKPTSDKRQIDRTVKTASKSKGNYKGTCTIRVWECINERNI